MLGHLRMRIGLLDAAHDAYERVLGLGNTIADKAIIAIAYGNLGGIYMARGNKGEACRYWTDAKKLFEEIGAVDKAVMVQSWMEDEGCGES